MLDMIHAVPEPLRPFQSFDARTAAYYASLQELEQRLRQLWHDHGMAEEQSRKSTEHGDYIELTDYLFIEDV